MVQCPDWCGGGEEGFVRKEGREASLVQVKKCTDCIIMCVYMYANVRRDRQVSILTDRKVDSKADR